MEEHEQIYAENRDKLLGAIGESKDLLGELKEYSRERWSIQYPTVVPTYTSEPKKEGKEVTVRPVPARSFSTPLVEAAGDMSVLRLDLKVGSAATTPTGIVHHLEKTAVAQLMDGRMTSSLRQLESLRQRISDTQSKVLVTGDLNAGKSTFVNALLRRKAMPIDQQPCTTVFCEVLDAEKSNNGVEEVHVVDKGVAYDNIDASTYTVHPLSDVEKIMMHAEEMDQQDAPIVKCYCNDTRATQESLLRNGVVDISLIDAPGLNRDSLKTTALFARQEEIDVIVFCVSAENHFTLSAKEFLLNASNDKAYVFIVVNKYDQIQNKERCRARVLEQIRQLSPRTYEDAENLVHFVNSSSVMKQDATEAEVPTSFVQLEAALRDFVLLKRNKSKLLPAQTYLLNLLSDVDFLARANIAVAERELEEAQAALAEARPALQKIRATARKLEAQMEDEEDRVVTRASDGVRSALHNSVEKISLGAPAVEEVSMPEYPGLMAVWEYAHAVRQALLQSMDVAVRQVEDMTRESTDKTLSFFRELGEKNLPVDENNKKQATFDAARMFSKRRQLGTVAALGLSAEMTQVRLSDIFDAKHHLLVITGTTDEDNAKKDHEEEMSMVNSFSIGLGALTLLGGKAFGAKTAMEAFVRITDIAGNPTVRRWALPVCMIASTGMVAWTIIDLPNSIPRNIGRAIARELKQLEPPAALIRDAERDQEGGIITVTSILYTFEEIHARRIGRDARKILRFGGYDVSERFRMAISKQKQFVQTQEDKEKKAGEAQTWFNTARGRASNVCVGLDNLKGWEH
ncbi:uncharacterized protein FA14DRAFT_127775 [Meira miltonrushii]|uniref:Dynamin-type G domain-containing protein n=1 Tax=Meira miltonrushii TaxID=1280837 RepID=A0A316V2C9_9BASI|nr:uncharacterized protein FA14DRAFT_127775 [Meira miltonrushii]PWN31706.1 hypothetical protein FA14DRAFT_127775 [Meira miltonrushii]